MYETEFNELIARLREAIKPEPDRVTIRLVTLCGSTREMEWKGFPPPEIRIPIPVPFNLTLAEGLAGLPMFEERRFRYARTVSMSPRVIVYRETD